MLRKIYLILLKYIPVVQMAGILLNILLYFLEVDSRWHYLLYFLGGNSVINIIMIYIASHIFKFCVCHRLIIISNSFSVILTHLEPTFSITINCIDTVLFAYIITMMFVLFILLLHLKQKI